MIRALLLDYDGVIRHMNEEKTRNVLEEHGFQMDHFFEMIWKHEISQELVRGTISRQEWWKKIQEIHSELVSIPHDFIWNKVFAYPEINFDVLNLVKEINSQYITAILSNADQRSKEIIREQTASVSFDHILTSSDFGYIKPEPEIYYKTLETIAVKPSECLFFDDNVKNVRSANELGIQAYLFENTQQIRFLLGHKID